MSSPKVSQNPRNLVVIEKDIEAEIFSEFEEALRDIEGFSHIYLIYYFHETTGYKPLVKTFLDDERKHGLFATRHHNRPNLIGISIVELTKRERNILKVRQVDTLDGTLLLDINLMSHNLIKEQM